MPFSGFYETCHREALRDRFDVGENSDPKENEAEWQKRWDEYCLHHKENEQDYCREYVRQFSKMVGIGLEYKDLVSPKEYNFSTDRIFAEISASDVKELKRMADPERMRALVKLSFTSCDGFSSFYSNDYGQWLKDEEAGKPFDHNQVGTLLECVAGQIDDDWELTVFEMTNANF